MLRAGVIDREEEERRHETGHKGYKGSTVSQELDNGGKESDCRTPFMILNTPRQMPIRAGSKPSPLYLKGVVYTSGTNNILRKATTA